MPVASSSEIADFLFGLFFTVLLVESANNDLLTFKLCFLLLCQEAETLTLKGSVDHLLGLFEALTWLSCLETAHQLPTTPVGGPPDPKAVHVFTCLPCPARYLGKHRLTRKIVTNTCQRRRLARRHLVSPCLCRSAWETLHLGLRSQEDHQLVFCWTDPGRLPQSLRAGQGG